MSDVTRRSFLAATALGAAGLAGASRAGAALPRQPEPKPDAKPDAPKKRTLRKAVMIGMVGDGANLMEKFAILRDCGFEGVELDSPNSLKESEVLEAIEKTGIKVHGVVDSAHWKFHLNNPTPEVRAKGVEALRTALHDARVYKSSSVLLVPGVVNKEMPYDECYRLSQEAIRSVLPQARECNVKIAVENVWNNFLLSPIEAARYIDDFKDPLVGWHFDIGNIINYGWPDQWARILGHRILKLHIKDFSRKKRDDEGLWKGFSVELGEGDAGWASLLKALDDVDYTTARHGNWATAEVSGGDRARLKKISEQMDRLFAM